MKILFSSDVSFSYFKEYPGDDTAVTALKDAREYFKAADFSIINLESMFGVRENFTPIEKSGPNLISKPEFKKYIEYLSPDAACFANNHTGDYGKEPILDTVKLLNEMGITTFGGGADIYEAYMPVKFEKNGVKVAVIGVCENEFGIATATKAGAAGYSLGRVTAAIQSAAADGYIPVVYFHGGNEYMPFPAPSKKELYRHFIDIGAGAVVAMHTHCPQGYETYRDAPIIYSMGNLLFPVAKPWRPIWYYGYMSTLTFGGGKIGVEFVPYRQDFEGIHFLKGEELEHFERYFKAICAPIQDDELLQHYFDAWCIYRDHLGKLINHSNGLEGGLPALKNMLVCEAHNDVLTNGVRLLFDGAPDNVEQLTKDIEALQKFEIPESLVRDN